MKKTLYLFDGNENTKFILDYKLNKLNITIVIKKSEFWVNSYSKEYEITDEFNLDELIEEFYLEYSKLKEIEMIWEEELRDMEVIELNTDFTDAVD